MNKLTASKLAIDLTKKALDAGVMPLKAGAIDAGSLSDFIITLAKRLEDSDLPDASV